VVADDPPDAAVVAEEPLGVLVVDEDFDEELPQPAINAATLRADTKTTGNRRPSAKPLIELPCCATNAASNRP
jgi:hypothetical protein